MRAALEHARITPDDVDYVCAHGTGTPANDAAESKAIKSALPNYRDVPVSSIKSALGHTLGAASAIETIRLIPYGCTKFRISMFPVTTRAWAPQ